MSVTADHDQVNTTRVGQSIDLVYDAKSQILEGLERTQRKRRARMLAGARSWSPWQPQPGSRDAVLQVLETARALGVDTPGVQFALREAWKAAR